MVARILTVRGATNPMKDCPELIVAGKNAIQRMDSYSTTIDFGTWIWKYAPRSKDGLGNDKRR